MPKILNVAIFIGILVILSQFARTSTNVQTAEAIKPETGQQNQFQLKQSFPIGTESDGLLATVYSSGNGEKQKEILSIWSRESNTYELQYIKTAAAGQAFSKPEIFSIEEINFIKISTKDRHTGDMMVDAVLSVTRDSTVHEIHSKQAEKLIKIHSRRS